MNGARSAIVLGACALLSLYGKPAAACGPEPAPFFTVDRQAPQGTGVALNAPIVVQLLRTTNGDDAPPLLAELTLTEVTTALPVEWS